MKKIITFCFCFLPVLLLAQQQQPCRLLKNIETVQDIPELFYGASLQQAGDNLFFIGATCTESPEVYAINIGQDSVYLPYNAWPDPRNRGWCEGLIVPVVGHSQPQYLTPIGNRLFYTLPHPQFGFELFVTDGTLEGSGLVLDIAAGTSSSPEQLTVFRNEVWFSADDGVNGRELWRSDGTPEGTQMVLDIAPGAAGSRPLHLCTTGDELFFVAATPGDSSWLWRSDGTAEGTIPWLPLAAISEGYMVESLHVAGGLLFLVTYNQSAKKVNLYVANVQNNTLELIIEEAIVSIYQDIPKEFTEWGGMVYFAASTQAYGRELWRTDGTVAGTLLFKDINSGEVGSNPSEFQILGNKIYFRAKIGNSELLYSTDGTPESTGPASLSPLPTSGINRIKAGDGQLFFTSGDRRELWRTDGIETERISGTVISHLWDMKPVAGGIYFFGNSEHHYGLWKWNGTPGTIAEPVTSLGRLDGNSLPDSYQTMRNYLYFRAPNPSNLRQQIWRTDGTSEGTIQITNLAPPSSIYLRLSVIRDSLLIFSADNTSTGTEPWVSNGLPGQESMIVNTQPGAEGSINHPNSLSDGILCYYSVRNRRLYRTDGTAAGTIELTSDGGFPFELLVFNGYTYLVTGGNPSRLLKTDGTPAGTSALIDSIENYYPGRFMNVFNGRLWIFRKGADNHWGLWRSNNDASAFELAVPLNPPGTGSPSYFITHGDHMYFFADDGINGVQYYQSDGTVAGTRPFLDADVPARPTLNYYQPVIPAFWRGQLYYTSHLPEYGREMFVSDGTADGTYLLADILPGIQSSDPIQLGTAFTDSLFFFTAFTRQHGRELWQTDGTPEGTFMVQDICPGPCSSSPDQLNIIGDGTLLFNAYHPGVGIEPWIYRFATGPSTETEDAGSPSLERLLVFPNPNAGERFYVSLPEMRGSHHIEVLDLRGVVLASERIAGAGSRVHELLLPELSNGMYLLRLVDGDGRLRAVEKLLVIGR